MVQLKVSGIIRFVTLFNCCIITDGEDFLSLSSECQGIDFTPSEGTQTRCSFIEILDDDVPEANEQFMVRLFSSNLQVTFINGVSEATVTIIDDDGDELPSTAGTEMPTVAGGKFN